MKKRYDTLFKEDGLSVMIDKNNNSLKIGVPGYTIEKQFEEWVTDDKTYTNNLLVKEINRLQKIISDNQYT